MNHKALVNKLTELTDTDFETCENIVKAYEIYCETEKQRPFKQDIDEKMVESISTTTSYDALTVKAVLTSLISVVQTGIVAKIPFIKKGRS
ncbi:hypothetical protein ACYSNW_00960 [Enterococcus sp. LJL99]